MADDPSYILDIRTGDASAENSPPPAAAADNASRSWVGIRFDCCGVYTRIYRNREGDAYEGRCPRCSRPVRLRVGEGGTTSRLFRAE
jgi:hypothetical protein